MFRNILKLLGGIDLIFIEKIMQECNKNNVKEFKLKGKDSIEITFK